MIESSAKIVVKNDRASMSEAAKAALLIRPRSPDLSGGGAAFLRGAGPLGDAAQGVIHCPVQSHKEGCKLLPGGGMSGLQGVLRGADGDVDEKVALNRRTAAFEVPLRLGR